MPKAIKDAKTRMLTAQESAYMLMPWSCNVHPTFSEIEAYLPITGNFEIVADIHDTKGVAAGLITRAVNSYEKLRELIDQMAAALELCLNCHPDGRLTWEAEHEALAVLKKHLLSIDGRTGTIG